MFKRIITGILGLILATGAMAQTVQNCNFEIKPHNVTCKGGADGSAEVWKDGKLVEITTGNGTCPGTCVSTPAVSTTPCGTPLPSGAVPYSSASGEIYITGGTVYLTATNFNGDVKFEGGGGGKLIICNTATINNFNFNSIPEGGNPIEIIVNGNVTLTGANLQMHQVVLLKNYGTLNITQSIGFLGKLYNYGTINASSHMSINASTAQLYNSGTLNVLNNGMFNNYNLTTNYGTIEVSGEFHNNGNSTLVNYCKVIGHNNFHIDGPVDNYGMITVDLETQQKNTYTARAGSLLKTNSLMLNSVIEGAGATCASVKVTGVTTLNGSGLVQGNVDLCSTGGISYSGGKILSPATTNCSCVAGSGASTCPSQGPNGTITWNTNSIGTVVLNGASITNLTTQGNNTQTYTVTIALQGCSTVTKSFTITQPSLAVTASAVVNGMTATINASGGNDINYTYVWSDNYTSQNNVREFTGATTLYVTVKDSKGCTSGQVEVKIEGGGVVVGDPCSVKITSNTNNTFTINATKVGNTYVLQSGTAVSSIIKRPCADSTIQVVDCQGVVSELKIQGKGGVCDPTSNCPDPSNPACNCPNPTNPFCTNSCPDPADPSCCVAQLDPTCVTSDPTLTGTVVAFAPKCSMGGVAKITVTGGSGKYYTFNKVNNQHGLYITGLPVGKTVITIRDKETGKETNVVADVPVAPVSVVQLVNAADPVLAVNNSFSLNITNAVSGPYKLNLGKLYPYKQSNIVANGTSLNLGPYTIPSNLGNGPFNIVLTDAYCKEYVFDVYRNRIVCSNITAFTPNIVEVAPSVYGAKDGSLTITNLPANVQALWSIPNQDDYVLGSAITGLAAGTYSLILKSAISGDDCFVGSTLQKTLGEGPKTQLGTVVVGASCAYTIQYSRKNADGSVNTNPLAGPLSYAWINPVNDDVVARTQSFDPSKYILFGQPSYLKIELRDANGKLAEGEFVIPAKCRVIECDPLLDPNCCLLTGKCPPKCTLPTDPSCPELQVTYVATPAGCNQGGKVVLTVTNGSGNYSTRNLINDQTWTEITGLPVGQHLIWVKDLQTLKNTSITVEVPVAPTTVVKVQNNVDPLIADNNAFTIVLDEAFAGPYSLNLPNIEPYDQRNLVAGANGHLVLGPYYLPANQGNGPFPVSLTDAYCKTYDLNVYRRIIPCSTQTVAYRPIVTVGAKPSYFGGSDGVLVLSNPPQNAQAIWSGSTFGGTRTGNSLTGIAAGSYHLVVKDQNSGCIYYEGGEAPITLEDGPVMEPVVEVSANCNFTINAVMKNRDGSLSTQAANVTSYKWYNYLAGQQQVIATTQSVQVSTLILLGKPKSLVVEVTNAAGKVARNVFSIPDKCYPVVPPPCSISFEYVVKNPTCNEGTDGNIQVKSLSPGAYVRWITPALTTVDAYGWVKNNLKKGDYEVLVKLNETCFQSYTITLLAPPALEVSHEDLVPKGVKISVQYGTAPFSYKWKDQSTAITTSDRSISRTDLVANVEYEIEVIDNKGCKKTYKFTYSPCSVTKPNPYQVYVEESDEVVVIANGGTPEFEYYWQANSANADDQLIDPYGDTKGGLKAGMSYTVTVSDVKGCTGAVTFTKQVKKVCTFDVTVNSTKASAGNVCDATSTVELTNTSQSYDTYTILWDKENIIELLKKSDGLRAIQEESKIRIINVCSGKHEVFVKSSQGETCALLKDFNVEYTTEVVKPDCNLNGPKITVPGSQVFTLPCGSSGVDINFSVSGGKQAYTYDWTYGDGVSSTDVKEKSDKSGYTLAQVGSYTVKVTDANLCTATQTFTVQGLKSTLEASAKAVPPTCVNGTGTLTVSLIKAKGGEIISWDDATSNHSYVRNDVVGGNTYYYTIRDANNCVLERKSKYVDPYTVSSGSYSTRDYLCVGQTADLVAKYNPDYSFLWSAPAGVSISNPSAEIITVSEVGTYTITYTHKTRTAVCPQWTETIAIQAKTDCIPVTPECKVYDYEVPEPSDTNSCELAARLAAEAEGLKKYDDYIEKIKQDFTNGYIGSVMGSLKETLKVGFTDQEHHYTLYYYDQAGNLTRTVPPAGVARLSDAQTKQVTDYWASTLAGQTASVPNVVTQHILPTTYKYNSLNQLIAQDMPDHRQQDLWETTGTYTLPAGLTLSTLDAQGNKVLLFANTNTGTPEAKLFSSIDQGKTFAQVENLGVGTINDLQRAGATGAVYYAVGSNGTLLKALNGPADWFLLSAPSSDNFVKVYFSDANNGIMLNDKGEFWITNSGANTLSTLSSNLKSTLGATTMKRIDILGNTLYVTTSADVLLSASLSGLNFTNLPASSLNFSTMSFKAPAMNTLYTVGTSTYTAGVAGSLFKLVNGKLVLNNKTNLTEDVQKIHTDGSRYLLRTVNNTLYYSADGKNFTISNIANVYNIKNVNGNLYGFNNTSNLYKLSNTGFVAVGTAYTGTVMDYEELGTDTYVGINNSTIMKNGTSYNLSGANMYYFTKMAVIGGNIALLNGNILTALKLNAPVQGATTGTATTIGGTISNINNLYQVGTDWYTVNSSNQVQKITLTGSIFSLGTALFTLPTGFRDLTFGAITSGSSYSYQYIDQTGLLVSVSNGSSTASNNLMSPSGLAGVATGVNSLSFTAGSKSQLYALNGSVWEYHSVPVQEEDIAQVTSEDGPKLRLASQTGKLYAHNIAYGTYTTGSFAQESITGVSNNTLGAAPEVLSNRYLLTTGNKVYSYTGSTWQEESTFTSDKDMVSLSGNLQNAALPLLGGLTGALQYKLGGTWTKANPVKIQPIADLAHDGSLSIAVGQKGTLLKSTDFGTTWSPRLSNVNNSDFSTAAVKGSKALAGTSDGKLVYSTNSGDTWTVASFSPVNTDAITSISIPSASEAWVLAGTKVYYSSNFSSFTKVMDATQTLRGITVSAEAYGYIVGDAGTAYRIQPTGTFAADQTASLITLNTQNSALKIVSDANISDDKGTGIPQVQSLRSVSFTDRLVGYMTTGSGLILKTTDGGYHWITENSTTEGNTQIALSDAENGVISTGNQVSTLRDRAQKLGSRFWYDELGRLVLSQNSKQYNIKNYLGEQQYADVETTLNTLTQNSTSSTQIPRAYSYTLYDDIGRIVEVGELVTKAPVTTYKVETQVKYKDITAGTGILNSGVKQQITRTYYDEQVYTVQVNGYPFAQENLRPRVASVTYSDRQSPAGGGAGGGSYDRATHYSYDIHGNVKTLVQEIKSNVQGLNSNVLTKRLDYDYDLISGKVSLVYYQKNQDDQLVHKYTYDGDNRITKIETSTDGISWTRDVKYEYYAHGPLAQTQLGAQNVETSVYAYTLQGWIKGVKGQNFSYALGYNNNDYRAVGSDITGGMKETPIANNAQGHTTGLYNGNIATWATNTPALSVKGVADMTNQYTYDQLNRIKASTVFGKVDAYRTGYSYDANGNIQTLQRYNGTGQLFDQFTYNYENKGAGYLQNTNKLRSVDDAITNTALHEEDLEDQNIDNYQYDDIGNLSYDRQEDVEKIEWTVYGKVKAVYRKAGSLKPNLVFEYDASGNRVSKVSIANSGTVSKTYYLRDAVGNVMSTYVTSGTSSLSLSEQYLYGRSRLGVFEKGNRSYELTDHLGNVRAMVSEFLEVKAAYEYYAFGMSLAKIDKGYRYGFNGKENDDETGLQDYGMRWYDNRRCQFISVDPLGRKYPWYTPFQFAGNKPISHIDLDGLEEASPDPSKAGALKAIEDFRNDPSIKQGVFKGITKEQFANDLKKMIEKPTSITQGDNNLCGVATSCKVAADQDPYNLVKLAIDLYSSGEEKSCPRSYVLDKIQANSKLYDATEFNGLTAAEFVLFTSIRNDGNATGYDPNSWMESAQGITWPGQVTSFLTDHMWINDESPLFSNFVNAQDINDAIEKGQSVMVLTSWNEFKYQGIFNPTSMHYIQIMGVSVNTETNIHTVTYWNPHFGNIDKVNLTKAQFDDSIMATYMFK